MEERKGGARRVDQAWKRERCWGRVCCGSGHVVTEDIEGFELLDLRGLLQEFGLDLQVDVCNYRCCREVGCRRSRHGLQEPVLKRTDVHRNSGLVEAQGLAAAAVADLQISKNTTFLEGKSEEKDIVVGEENDFAGVVKVRVVSGGVGEGIARW
ncbi:hypothetical protein ACFX2H_045731 [Malus domestica]